MRTFVMMRKLALSQKEISEKLSKLEEKYDKQFNNVYEALNYLLEKEVKQKSQAERPKIGYK